MAILTVHHWDAEQERGVRELRRVARGPVVILTFDAVVCARMWLLADYLPEVAELDGRIFPPIARLTEWLGPDTSVRTIAVPADTPDWTLAAFWAHPERVLDPAARAATSGFARMQPAVVARVVARLRADLESGAWDARHGDLRRLSAYDAGLRLVVSPGEPHVGTRAGAGRRVPRLGDDLAPAGGVVENGSVWIALTGRARGLFTLGSRVSTRPRCP